MDGTLRLQMKNMIFPTVAIKFSVEFNIMRRLFAYARTSLMRPNGSSDTLATDRFIPLQSRHQVAECARAILGYPNAYCMPHATKATYIFHGRV